MPSYPLFSSHVPVAALLDDLDKELNNYIMRCREWYGWHFPELGKIITDNLAYCKSVRKIGEHGHFLTLICTEMDLVVYEDRSTVKKVVKVDWYSADDN